MRTLADKIIFMLCAKPLSSLVNHTTQFLLRRSQYTDNVSLYEQCI